MEQSADRIVWIDCEMTGLDLQRDALVEVAVLVTDSEPERARRGPRRRHRPTARDARDDAGRRPPDAHHERAARRASPTA
nr:exonuclease domain-containing protein [Angustibacter aerolatus]